MAKQEEIREGLISKVKSIRLWATNPDDPLTAEDDADDILGMLHSQGVVIKEEGGLPKPRYPNSEIDAYIWEGQQDMLKAGYTKWSPLMRKEKTNDCN